LTLTQNRKILYLALTVATILLAIVAVSGVAFAQTFNPQQPPDFGNFNGTRPDFPGDFNGSQGFPNGGMGPGGFNGTFPDRDGNFSMPNFSGMPFRNDVNSGQVSGTQTDYTLIIVAILVVFVAVIVAVAVVLRKKKAGTKTHPQAEESKSENFDF
jgi:hypothetical protein